MDACATSLLLCAKKAYALVTCDEADAPVLRNKLDECARHTLLPRAVSPEHPYRALLGLPASHIHLLCKQSCVLKQENPA